MWLNNDDDDVALDQTFNGSFQYFRATRTSKNTAVKQQQNKQQNKQNKISRV